MMMRVPMAGTGRPGDPHRPDLPEGVSYSVVDRHDDGTVTVATDWTPTLQVNRYAIPADGQTRTVATYPTNTPVYFVVDGEPTLIEPDGWEATLELAADAPGAITVQVCDATFVVVAEEVPS